MDEGCSSDGVDSNKAYRVDVTVRSFASVKDGRKEYCRGRILSTDVEWQTFSMLDLVLYVGLFYDWGSDEEANFWYAGNKSNLVKVCTDAQLLDLFTQNRDTRVLKLVMTVEKCDCQAVDQSINLYESQVLDESHNVTKKQVDESHNVTVGDMLLDGSTSHPLQPPEGLLQEQEGRDPDEDEPVLLGKEWRYLSDEDPPQEHGDGARHAIMEHYIHDEGGQDMEDDVTDFDPLLVPDDELAPETVYDRESPIIQEEYTFPSSDAFKLTLRQYAIKKEFEYNIQHSDTTRFRAKCAAKGCPWYIYAKKLHGAQTFMVRKMPFGHECSSTSKTRGKMASKAWIADRGKELLRLDPSLGAKKLQQWLQASYNVELSYNKVWEGRKDALLDLHGTWEESFDMLWSFKAQLERCNPGNIVEVDCKKVAGKVYFKRMFVALRACIDGFLLGCRPYLGVDSTHLTGKYNGQFATAIGIDGHNWMYPVAYAIFDKETTNNWEWFMVNLKRAIGIPTGLVIHTDACKGLEAAVANIFGASLEHRECFRHLLNNFRRKFKGDVLKYMWPAAWAFTPEKHQKLLDIIGVVCPTGLDYLIKEHPHLWTRGKFSTHCKVDYVNNNIAESFNNWIKDIKDLPVVELMDKMRQMIMAKLCTRKRVAAKLQGRILPSVIQELNYKSRALNYTIAPSGYLKAEVSGLDSSHNAWRYVVDLEKEECSCRQWQLTGKPCTHALALICSKRRLQFESYVHDYYSVEKFRAAYEFEINPMGDKSQWPVVNKGYVMYPPKLTRVAGRPRKKRIKPRDEGGGKKQYQCKRCFRFGHIQKGCSLTPLDDPIDTPPPPTKKTTRGRKESSNTDGAVNTAVTPLDDPIDAPPPPTKKRAAQVASPPRRTTPTRGRKESSNTDGVVNTAVTPLDDPIDAPPPPTKKRAAQVASPPRRTTPTRVAAKANQLAAQLAFASRQKKRKIAN